MTKIERKKARKNFFRSKKFFLYPHREKVLFFKGKCKKWGFLKIDPLFSEENP